MTRKNNEEAESSQWRNLMTTPGAYVKGQSIEVYLVALDSFMTTAEIAKSKRTGLAISIMGTYALSQILNFGEKDLIQCEYEELKEVLLKRFSNRQSQLYERVQFLKLRQENKNIEEYVAALKESAAKCGFKDEEIKNRLLESFVAGLKDEKLAEECYLKSKLDWDTAVQIAKLKELRGKEKEKEKDITVFKVEKKKCLLCGKLNHMAKECFFKNKKCFTCKKVGHSSKVCFSKKDNKPVKTLELNMLDSGKNNKILKEFKVGNKKILFEVDTGAEITIIPKRIFYEIWTQEDLVPTRLKVTTASGDEFQCIGLVRINVGSKIASIHVMPNRFDKCLMGRNILDAVFPEWRKMFETEINTVNVDENAKAVLEKYEKVFKENESANIKNFEVAIHLKEDAKPIFAKAYTTALAIKPKIEAEIDRMIKNKILYPVKYSDWASPVVAVPKKDGTIRLCVDFKKTVNKNIKVDQYPIPVIDEVVNKVSQGKIFTVLDLSKAYQQLKVKKWAQELLTINTHKGLYRFTRLPFGISCAPACFQWVMDQILAGLTHTTCYLDDIIITGNNIKECKKNVCETLDRMEEHGVIVNVKKSSFFVKKVVVLGHEISSDGIKPSPEKVKDLLEIPTPMNINELRAYLGFINYYRKFIKDLATIVQPLYGLLQKEEKFKWTKRCEEAFSKSKEALSSSEAITFFDESRKTLLTTDASEYGLGAVLSQIEGGKEKVVYFWSRSLSKSERKYPQIQKEALGIVEAVKKFHKFLFGRKFVLITDHKPFKTIFGPDKSLPRYSMNRLQNYAVFLSAYQFEIQHRNGKEICNADGLSRLPIEKKEAIEEAEANIMEMEVSSNLIDGEELAKETEKDEILQEVKCFIDKGFPRRVNGDLLPFWNKRLELAEVNGIIFWGKRVIVPEKLREKVIELIHKEHMGITKMKMLAKEHIWFPGILSVIEEKARNCSTCLRFEKQILNKDLTSWPKVYNFFDRIHLDYFSKEKQDFIILADAYSKFIDVKQVESLQAKVLLEYLRDIISLFGYPDTIVTDNGPPFTSVEVQMFCDSNKIKHVFSPPYHPQSNGLVERAVGIVKENLNKISFETPGMSIKHQINRFLFQHRNSPTVATGKSPMEMILKIQPRTSLSLLKRRREGRAEFVTEARFREGEFVRVRNVMEKDKRGNWEIGKVLLRVSEKLYKIWINGKEKLVHIGNLKKSGQGGDVVYRQQEIRRMRA